MPESEIHGKLYGASWAGDDARVRELLATGANPNKYKDHAGNTALHSAANRGHNEVVTTLITAGADLNIQNKNGDTALHIIAKRGKHELMKLWDKIASAMKSASTDILQKEEYDDKLSYGFYISAAIVQREHERAFQFLTRNSDRKGMELTIYKSTCI